MIPKAAIDTVINLWPMIILITVVLISIRLVYLKTNHKKIYFYKEIMNLFFLIYILLLFELVTTTDMQSYGNNFIPLKEMFRYNLNSKLFYRNVVGNIVLFIPFGYFISYYCNAKKGRYSILIAFITSLTIETIQMNIGRSFDIDDIILNVIGGFIGYLFYIIFDKMFSKASLKLKNDLLLNVICLIIIIILCMIILNLYGVGISWVILKLLIK